MDILKYQQSFQEYLLSKQWVREPKNLYEPIDYIIQLGGKRMRPILTLMACDIFCDNYEEALPAALAVEVFHNFTLIHDDIMDDAPLRRGKKTVHEKWDLNTGILSGDAMLILAYQYFENYEPTTFRRLARLFSKTALEVCDGQQLDVDFETRNDVSIAEYLEMIRLKTSVLVGAALEMGAIVSKTTDENASLIYDFGMNLGLAFQLQDDYLDTFGNPETFGKQVGGDIMENKKTFLYLKALQDASDADKQVLLNLYAEKLDNSDEKVLQVKSLFEKYKIPTQIKVKIEAYTKQALATLDGMEIPNDKKQNLTNFALWLMNRAV